MEICLTHGKITQETSSVQELNLKGAHTMECKGI